MTALQANASFDVPPPSGLPFLQGVSTVAEEVVTARRIIELDDLPEPIVRGLEVVAEMARVLAGKPAQQEQSARPTKLSTRKGVVYRCLRREDIYDDLLTHKTAHHA